MHIFSYRIPASIVGLVGFMVCCFGIPGHLSAQPWTNTNLPASQRASLLVAAMTFDEKVAMVQGMNDSAFIGYVSGNITNNPRLGIPELTLNDGPAGVRIRSGGNSTTAFPAPIAIAATWNTALARQYGAQMGAQARGKGIDVLLGPMMNIPRAYQAGRNFEGGGEDPYLSGVMAAAEVNGIQSQGVIATAKHFVCNDQETLRTYISSDVDERTRQEIYYPPFLKSVRAGVGAVMASYNRVNGRYAGESEALNATLKKSWGFNGLVMSDWSAFFSTAGGMNNGMDLDMFCNYYTSAAITNAIQSGNATMSELDGMATRVLTSMFQFRIFDNPPTGNINSLVTNSFNVSFTRGAAAEGMVLLKNDRGLLPFGSSIHSVAVIGSVASNAPISIGSGSAAVALFYNVTPLAGIKSRILNGVTLNYAQGDGAGGSITSAAQLAASSDVAIVCVGQQTGEFNDRTNLSLPGNQDALISAVAAANTNTIVVVYSSSATLMPWANDVAGILMAWYPGQENGNSLAQVLFGVVTPSAKLPISIPVSSNQMPVSTTAQFPGVRGHVSYSEGLNVGYRWFDANNVPPLFPFGFGLSYTTFGYSNLTVSAVSPAGQVQIGFDLTNTGSRTGVEVAELYLGFPAAANEPPKSLKGFQKISLSIGQTKHLTFNLNWEDLANWDATARGWIVTPGQFQVMVGASSRDIRLAGTFTVSSPIPSSDLANLALHQPVTVSSFISTNVGSAAVDGDPSWGWSSSTADPQWISTDLGVIRDLSRVRLAWGTNYASTYMIQTSPDGTNWSGVFSTNNDVGGIEDILVSGRGRYVRIYGTAQGSPGGGYSLSELEVYSQPQRPFGGAVNQLPGRIQAENYDTGGEGVAYYDSTPTNSGSVFRSDDVDLESTTDVDGNYDVTDIDAGEWLEYTVNVPNPSAIYSIKARVASASVGQMRVRLDGTLLGTIQILNTGNLQTWQTVTLTNIVVSGSGGSHALRLEMVTGGHALNWIEFNRIQICGTNNLAFGQSATASSVQSISTPVSASVDGDPTTRWSSASSDPQWFQVDLGTVQKIGRVRLNWEDAYAQSYNIQLSADSNTWTTVYTTTNGAGTINDLAALGSGRYVRVTGTQRGTSYGYSLWELEAYAASAPDLTIALSGINAVISWPASLTDWSLQSTSSLGAFANWSDVANAPQLLNSEYTITNDLGAVSKFYRLKQN
jgi:beta-glucosidase